MRPPPPDIERRLDAAFRAAGEDIMRRKRGLGPAPSIRDDPMVRRAWTVGGQSATIVEEWMLAQLLRFGRYPSYRAGQRLYGEAFWGIRDLIHRLRRAGLSWHAVGTVTGMAHNGAMALMRRKPGPKELSVVEKAVSGR